MKHEFRKMCIFNLFFHFYFLKQNFSLNISFTHFKLYRYVTNILMDGTVSQILYLWLSFDFIWKNGKLFVIITT